MLDIIQVIFGLTMTYVVIMTIFWLMKQLVINFWGIVGASIIIFLLCLMFANPLFGIVLLLIILVLK